MAKRKQNTILIMIVAIVIAIIFAVGSAFAANPFVLQVGTNNKPAKLISISTDISLVNTFETTPVLYGPGYHYAELSCFTSDVRSRFDVRLKYKLSWSNNLPTDNVILNFSNDVVYDDEYIYVTLYGGRVVNIISGVSFTTTDDVNYSGARLTLEITEKEKDNFLTYTTASKLYTDTPAGNAWLYSRNKALIPSGSDAYAVVYNYGYDSTHGATYPTGESAYLQLTNDQASDVSSEEPIVRAKWLAGNRSYIGAKALIVAKNPITLSVRLSGSWSNITNPGHDPYENCLYYNYAEGWTFKSYHTNGVFKNYEYQYTLPAGKLVYVPIAESIEITTSTNFADSNYAGATATTTVLLNGTTFNNKRVSAGFINDAGVSATTAMPEQDVLYINSTLSSPLLYDTSRALATGGQHYMVNLAYKSATHAVTEFNSKLRIYVSNGNRSLFKTEGENKTYATSFAGADLWYRDVFELDYQQLNAGRENVSTDTYEQLCDEIVIPTTVAEEIKTRYGAAYDAWIEVIPSAQTQESSSNNFIVHANIAKQASNTVKLTLTSPDKSFIKSTYRNYQSITVKLFVNKAEYVGPISSMPADWSSTWSNYYIKSGDVYTRNQNKDYRSGTSYYTREMLYGDTTSLGITQSNITALNGCTVNYTNGELTITNITKFLAFYNTVDICTIDMPAGDTLDLFYTAEVVNMSYNSVSTGLSSYSDYPESMKDSLVINNGFSNAFITNISRNNLLIRFNKSVGDEHGKFITLSDGYTYYAGVIFSLEKTGWLAMINLIMDSAADFEVIELTGDYVPGETGSAASWGTQAVALFDTLFS